MFVEGQVLHFWGTCGVKDERSISLFINSRFSLIRFILLVQ